MGTILHVTNLRVLEVGLELLDEVLDSRGRGASADNETRVLLSVLGDKDKSGGDLLLGDLLGLSGLGEGNGLTRLGGGHSGRTEELLDALDHSGGIKLGELDAEVITEGLDGGGGGDDGERHFS